SGSCCWRVSRFSLSLFVYPPLTRASRSTLFPYTTLFRSSGRHGRQRHAGEAATAGARREDRKGQAREEVMLALLLESAVRSLALDRKSTRLNSSHVEISYAVFCLKKKTT